MIVNTINTAKETSCPSISTGKRPAMIIAPTAIIPVETVGVRNFGWIWERRAGSSGHYLILFTRPRWPLLPARLSHIHPNINRTPTVSTGIIAVGAMIIAGLFPVDMLGQLVSLAVLIVFTIMCFGVLVLRYTQPNIY